MAKTGVLAFIFLPSGTCVRGRRALYKSVSHVTGSGRSAEPIEDQEDTMLLRTTDPFRDFDRLTQQVLGTTNRPVAMPMDAWREGDRFVIEFDLPGIRQESIDLDVERNVLTISAERHARNG